MLGAGGGAEARARLKQALPATDLNMVQQLCELLALALRNSGRVREPQARASGSRGCGLMPDQRVGGPGACCIYVQRARWALGFPSDLLFFLRRQKPAGKHAWPAA